MNRKTLNIVSVICISLVAMIVVVIYTPNPVTPSSNRETGTIQELQDIIEKLPQSLKEELKEELKRDEKEATHLKLVSEALDKVLTVSLSTIKKIDSNTVKSEKAFQTVRNLIEEVRQVKDEKLQRKSFTALTKVVSALQVSLGVDKLKNTHNGETKHLIEEKQKTLSPTPALNGAIDALNEVNIVLKAVNDDTQLPNEEQQYKSLIDVNTEMIEALTEISNAIKPFNKADFKSIIKLYREASVALTKAIKAIKDRNVELQRFNKENATLKSLIDKNIKSNVKLIETLTGVSKLVKALTKEIQRLNDKKPDFELLLVYLRNETHGIYLAHTALSNAQNTHYEFQKAKIKSKP